MQTVSVDLPKVTTYHSRAAGGQTGLAALGDPTRRRIFERLAERPQSVRELADGLPVSRPAVSQHLKVLKDAGLVSDRAVGARRIYQMNADGVFALRDYLQGSWNRALSGFKDSAERPSKEGS